MLIGALEEIRRTFYLYLGSLALLLLTGLARRYNRLFERAGESLSTGFFDVYPEYVSAFVGIFFGAFVVILCLQVHLLQRSLPNPAGDEDSSSLADLGRFPWVASPFQSWTVAPFLFWSAVAAGWIVLAWVTGAHLLVVQETPDPATFRRIGTFDLVILLATTGLLWRLVVMVKQIRRTITTAEELATGTTAETRAAEGNRGKQERGERSR